MTYNHNGQAVDKQRGVVLFMALIALVAMTMAGIAMVRSVDTGSLVAGNLAFKQSALQTLDIGIEAATNDLMTGPGLASVLSDNPGAGYYATLLPPASVNANGMPLILIGPTPGGAVVTPALNGFQARYVIERMCNSTAAGLLASSDRCLMRFTPPKAGSGKPPSGGPLVESHPYFRVSVRVDGPRGTQGFGQAMVFAQLP